MNYIKKKLAKFHKWYDDLKEPKRFISLLGFAMGPWVVLDIIGIISKQKVFEILGMVWIVLMILWRFWWIEGSLKNYLDE